MTDTADAAQHRDMLRRAVLARGGVWTSTQAVTLLRGVSRRRPLANGYGRDLLTDLEQEGILVRTGRSRWCISEAAKAQQVRAASQSLTSAFLRRCARLLEIREGLEKGSVTEVAASIGVRDEMEPNRDYPAWIDLVGSVPGPQHFVDATFEGGDDPLEMLLIALDAVE